MGSKARVVLYAESEPAAAAAATRAFERIAELDGVMSDYRHDSELSRLSGAPAGEWFGVSDDLLRVLSRAAVVSEASGGAFDATVAPAVALWREARETRRKPDAGSLAAARQRIGWRLVGLDRARRAVRFSVPGVGLDLGGIGKGYAAAEAIGTLRDEGHPAAMVDLGGDLAVGDRPPGAPGWRIRISSTLDDDRDLVLEHVCIATSGDAERSVEIGGVRYSHIIDPRTGVALTRRRAATVIHADGAVADALASAACVVGPSGLGALRRAFPDATVALVAPDDGP